VGKASFHFILPRVELTSRLSRIHDSVQGNHVHLIVAANGKQSLSRGMQGLTIRMARALNRMMQRQGELFAAAPGPTRPP
jgi:hypothetical protein